MKKLINLDKKVLTLDGKEYASKETCKDVLMASLYNSKSETKDAIRITSKLLPMLQADKHSGEFEDADWETIKKVIEENQGGLSNGVLGQILACFEEGAEK